LHSFNLLVYLVALNDVFFKCSFSFCKFSETFCKLSITFCNSFSFPDVFVYWYVGFCSFNIQLYCSKSLILFCSLYTCISNDSFSNFNSKHNFSDSNNSEVSLLILFLASTYSSFNFTYFIASLNSSSCWISLIFLFFICFINVD